MPMNLRAQKNFSIKIKKSMKKFKTSKTFKNSENKYIKQKLKIK